MMAAAREWLTAVVTVTLLLSVVQMLIPEGTLREIAGFIGGLLLLMTLLQPLLHADLSGIAPDISQYRQAVRQRSAALLDAQTEELTRRIESETAAYISDKAQSLGLTAVIRVYAEPNADGIPIPTQVEVTGPRSEALAQWLETELGFSRERQVWNES